MFEDQNTIIAFIAIAAGLLFSRSRIRLGVNELQDYWSEEARYEREQERAAANKKRSEGKFVNSYFPNYPITERRVFDNSDQPRMQKVLPPPPRSLLQRLQGRGRGPFDLHP